MVPKSFGDGLRVYRTGKGFSQKGLGLAVGLKQGQISDLENSKNKKECDPKLFEKICMALDTTVDVLNNFGPSNTIYQNAIKHLNKKKAEIYTTFSSDQKSIESFLLTMNILFKINEEYKKFLEDCVKKRGLKKLECSSIIVNTKYLFKGAYKKNLFYIGITLKFVQLNIFDRNLINESIPPFSVLLSNVLFSILTNWIYVPIAKKMNRTIKTEVKIIMSKSSILLFSFNI